MRIAKWIGLGLFSVTLVALMACHSPGELVSQAIDQADAEASVRSACAGTYASALDCASCVTETLDSIENGAGVGVERRSALQAAFVKGECQTRVLAGRSDDEAGDSDSSDDDEGVDDEAPDCIPTTCSEQFAECGEIADGCGRTLSCGMCGAGESCGSGVFPNLCEPTKLDCESAAALEDLILSCPRVSGGEEFCAFDVSNAFLPDFFDPNFNCDTACAALGLQCLEAYDGDFTFCLGAVGPLQSCSAPISESQLQPDMHCRCS